MDELGDAKTVKQTNQTLMAVLIWGTTIVIGVGVLYLLGVWVDH